MLEYLKSLSALPELGSVFGAVLGLVAVVVGFLQTRRYRSAAENLKLELIRQLTDERLANLMNAIEKRKAATEVASAAAQAELRELVGDALEKLSDADKELLAEGFNQPSSIGRERFVHRHLRESAQGTG